MTCVVTTKVYIELNIDDMVTSTSGNEASTSIEVTGRDEMTDCEEESGNSCDQGDKGEE